MTATTSFQAASASASASASAPASLATLSIETQPTAHSLPKTVSVVAFAPTDLGQEWEVEVDGTVWGSVRKSALTGKFICNGQKFASFADAVSYRASRVFTEAQSELLNRFAG